MGQDAEPAILLFNKEARAEGPRFSVGRANSHTQTPSQGAGCDTNDASLGALRLEGNVVGLSFLFLHQHQQTIIPIPIKTTNDDTDGLPANNAELEIGI